MARKAFEAVDAAAVVLAIRRATATDTRQLCIQSK